MCSARLGAHVAGVGRAPRRCAPVTPMATQSSRLVVKFIGSQIQLGTVVGALHVGLARTQRAIVFASPEKSTVANSAPRALQRETARTAYAPQHSCRAPQSSETSVRRTSPQRSVLDPISAAALSAARTRTPPHAHTEQPWTLPARRAQVTQPPAGRPPAPPAFPQTSPASRAAAAAAQSRGPPRARRPCSTAACTSAGAGTPCSPSTWPA